MRLSLALLALLFVAAPRVAQAQGPHVAPGHAGGGIAGAAPATYPEAERVRRIPIRAPLTLPNEGFPLFGLSYPPSASAPSREANDASVAKAAAPSVEPKAGTVRTRTETVYYEVEGASRADLAAALQEHGPNLQGRRFFGMTEWEVSAGYRPIEGASGCAMDAITVEVAITTHLPRWDRSAPVPASLRGAWDRFLHALDRHEHGHRALAEDAAEAIRGRLLATTASTCDRLDLAAQRTMAAVMREYEARNLAYDAETGHGRTQGAVW